MTPTQHQQVDALFLQLIELEDDPAAREATLATIDDPEVKAEVLSLLRHTGPREESLATSVGEVMRAAAGSGAFEDRTIGPGTRFERYRIERKLGQGGMGDVYEATRDNDFHKQVALKIVRYGLDSDLARARFQQERQTLAHLEHPYIARLIDGGEAANGCPYLVLEFVDGVPINDYTQDCSRNDILQLFLKVCEAVDYAHRNLIIHRDLKPANILVTADGTPKLLDFGIAKLLNPDPAASADVTQTMAIALTPQYASPEQVRNLPITTASDVYSLGVILYQLLTHRKPYQLDTTTALELDRIVCEQPPAPPQLGNELDDILMMSLRKEPQRRYPSPSALADDLQRFLAGRPVLAAPDTLAYRARKFVGLHKIGIAAVAAVILVLAGGLASTLYQKRQADQRFQQVRQLSNTFLFDINDQLVDIAGTTKTRGFVVKTAQRYLDSLSQSASNNPTLQAELAQAYERLADAQASPNKANLGDFAGAEASHRLSIQLYEGLARRDPAQAIDAVRSWRLLAFLYVSRNRLPEASKALDRAVEHAAPLVHDNSSKSLMELGSLYMARSQLAEQQFDYDSQLSYARLALQYDEAAFAGTPSGSEAKDTLLGRAHQQLARGSFGKNDLSATLAEHRQALPLYKHAFQSNPESVRLQVLYINELLNVTNVYGVDSSPSMDDPVEAGPYAREALALNRPLLAADSNDLSAAMNHIALLIADAASQADVAPEAALKNLREAAATWSRLTARKDLSSAYWYLGLDNERGILALLAKPALARLTAPGEARELADQLLGHRRKLLAAFPPTDDNFWFLADDLRAAAEVARSTGNTAEAGRLLQEALHVAQPFAAAAPAQTLTAFFAARLYRSLAQFHAATGSCAEAHTWQEKQKAVWAPLAPKVPYAATQARQAAAPLTCRR